MFDCGPAATHKLVKAGLYPTQVDNLFFTHHHFDHNIDYPCFLLCHWDQAAGKGQELNVYGPNLTEEITQKIIGVFGLRVRLASPSEPPLQPAGIRKPGRHPAPHPAGPQGQRRWRGRGGVGQRLAGHSGRGRALPDVSGLAGLPRGHARRKRDLHRRHPALRHGPGPSPRRGHDAVHVLGRTVRDGDHQRGQRPVRHHRTPPNLPKKSESRNWS